MNQDNFSQSRAQAKDWKSKRMKALQTIIAARRNLARADACGSAG